MENKEVKKPGAPGYDEIEDSAFLNRHKKTVNIIKKGLWFFVIVYLFTTLIFVQPVIASGYSMLPTINDGDFLLCLRQKELQRGDIVYLLRVENHYYPHRMIKRIVGMPGDSLVIKDGILYINGEKETNNFDIPVMNDPGVLENTLRLKDDEYFVLGDNRNNSKDSRYYGVFNKKQIKGVIYDTDWQIPPAFRLNYF